MQWSTYARKHKKSTEVPSGSGFQPPETWPYFDQLKFLDSYIKHRSTKDNFFEEPCGSRIIPSTETSSTTTENEANSPLEFDPGSPESVCSSATEPPSKRTKKSFASSVEIQRQMLNVMEKSSERLKTLDQPSTDRFDHFAAFVAAELRAKPPNVVGLYVQQITSILYSVISLQDDAV